MEPKETTESQLLIAHMGDIHLRDSQYASPQRSLDFSAAFEQAIRKAKDADVMVCVGDIFDTSRPSPKVIGQLIRVDHILQSLGKTMLCVTGNHDRSNPSWLDTLFPRADGPGIIPLDNRTITVNGFKFAGIQPYTAAQFRASTLTIEELCHDADVVLYHGFVTGVVPMLVHGDGNPLTVDELPVYPSIKAVLLADIHIQGHVQHTLAGCNKLVAYSGSLEMCSAAESTEKSVPMVRLTKTAATVESTVPIDTRMFITTKVTTVEELDALILRLRDVRDKNPVVIVEFERSLPDVISRVYASLDAEKALIRCKPLPHSGADYVRSAAVDTSAENRTIHDFMQEHFKDDVELGAIAAALIDRGDADASNILADFIDTNTNQQ